MTSRPTRSLLFGLFIGSFIVSVGLVGFTYFRHEIYADTMTQLLTRLLTVYSAPLGILIGWMTAARKKQPREVPTLVSVGIVLLTVIWNLLVVGRLMMFASSSSDDTVDALTSYFDTILPASYFLIAGGLSYFFAKQA